jgi:hypothetical protein
MKNPHSNVTAGLPDGSTALHLHYIELIFNTALSQGIKLWLESGWAIDARLGRVTRVHEDIDIAYPQEHHDVYVKLLIRAARLRFFNEPKRGSHRLGALRKIGRRIRAPGLSRRILPGRARGMAKR